MKSSLVSRMTLAAVAAAGLFVPAAAVSTPLAAASPAPQSQCSAAVTMPAAGFKLDEPANSCTDQKQQCMSASVQEGIYGERYVPPTPSRCAWMPIGTASTQTRTPALTRSAEAAEFRRASFPPRGASGGDGRARHARPLSVRLGG